MEARKALTEGRKPLVAVWPDPALKPQVGNLVWFARYAGAVFEGVDGREYRILKAFRMALACN